MPGKSKKITLEYRINGGGENNRGGGVRIIGGGGWKWFDISIIGESE